MADIPDTQDIIRAIVAVLQTHGADVTGVRSPVAVAHEWMDAGFEDAEEVEAWIKARCFDAAAAWRLEGAGITPEQAGIHTTAGAGGYADTLGFKLTRGDLSFDEARRIITSEFWNF